MYKFQSDISRLGYLNTIDHPFCQSEIGFFYKFSDLPFGLEPAAGKTFTML